MNPAISCIEDTLRLLLEEAKQAKETAAAKRGSPEEAFEVGRSEALTEALHTWANQLQTFALDAQLDGTWEELRAFLTNQGYCYGQGGGNPMSIDSSQPVGDEDRLDKLIVPAIRDIVGGEGFYRCERDLHHHLTSSLEKIVPLHLGSRGRLVGYEHPTTEKYTWKVGGQRKKSGNVDFCFFDRSADDGSPTRNTALEINYDYRSGSKIKTDCVKLADPRNKFRQGVYFAFGYKRNFKQSVEAGMAKAFALLTKQSPGFHWPPELYVYLVEHDGGDKRRLWQGTPDPSHAGVGGFAWAVLSERDIGTSPSSMLVGGDPDSLLTRSEAKGILEREFQKAGVPTDSKSARRMFEATKAKDGTNRCKLGKTPLWDCEILKVGDKVKRSVFAVWLRRNLEDAMRSQNASVKGKSK